MTATLVSVIVPVLDGESHIGAALESVLAQDHDAVEIVVVDDGSADRTGEIARSFEGVRVIRQENAGVAAARNRGVRESRGAYCAFLDHDDAWEPEKLRVQAAHLDAHPEIGFVVARLRFLLEAGATRPTWLRPELLEGPQPGRVPSNLMVRRRVFETVGPFRTTFQQGGEDVDWFARAADLDVRSEMLADALLLRRVHGDNVTGRVEASREDMFRALRESIARKRAKPDDAPGATPSTR